MRPVAGNAGATIARVRPLAASAASTSAANGPRSVESTFFITISAPVELDGAHAGGRLGGGQPTRVGVDHDRVGVHALAPEGDRGAVAGAHERRARVGGAREVVGDDGDPHQNGCAWLTCSR